MAQTELSQLVTNIREASYSANLFRFRLMKALSKGAIIGMEIHNQGVRQ